MIRTRFATVEDRDRVVDFVREHWIATHVFTERPDLLDWQHADGTEADDRLNFVLAEDDDGAVLGILGFIPLGHFDPALGARDITLAIWKVRDEGVPPGVGLNLLKHLKARLAPRLIAAIGTSEMVRPLYKALRYTVDTMQHCALFGPRDDRTTAIASGVPASAFAAAEPSERVELGAVTSDAPPALRDEIDRVAGDAVPAKSWTYIATRYLAHPWYRYVVRAVRLDGALVAVVVWRAVAAEDTTVLRIVDIVGDTAWLAHATHALQQEVVAAGAEYLDLVHWGVDPSHLAAWVSPADTEGLVLPNYFAPFERRNVEIGMAVRLFDDDPAGAALHLYRADSDQDRPNRVVDLDPGPAQV
ncbi:hypothetical protein [Jatrophihabitans fulvus]